MMNNLAKWTLAGTLAVLSACTNEPQTGGIALLDISLVSEKTGNTQIINSALQAKQVKLQADLAQLQTSIHGRISAQQKSIGEKAPTDEQKQKLAQMINQAQKEFGQAQDNAARSMKQEQERLVEEFRKKIQPLAQRVANSKKLGTVLLNVESIVLVSDPSVDITSDVIELMKKEFPAPSEPVKNADSEAGQDKTTDKVTTKVTSDIKTVIVDEKKVEKEAGKSSTSENTE